MSGPTTGITETLAEALAMHEYVVEVDEDSALCCCGEHVPIPDGWEFEKAHRAHRVQALLASPWMKRHDAEVRAEALREAADALIPFPDNDYGAFPWGAQKWLRDRAALAEEGDQ